MIVVCRDFARLTFAVLACVTVAACSGGGSGGSGSGGSGSGGGGGGGAAAPIAITSGPPPGAVVGFVYNVHAHCVSGYCDHATSGFSLAASGGVGKITWAWAAAPKSLLPPGLSLSDNVIRGTPPVGSVGNYNTIITATDGGTPAATTMQAYTISIVNPSPPVIESSLGPPGATLNQPYTYQFQVSGFAPTISATGAIPPGLAPVTSTGVLAGTPTSADLYPITIHATDAAGQETSQDFTIGVYLHGFSPTGSMQTMRALHTATLLANGQVLVTGGQTNNGGFNWLKSSELFTTTTGSFSTTGALQNARSYHTATLLCDLAASPCSNAKVLIVGGEASAGAIASAELYDPASGTFALTGSLATARYGHTATRLQSGKVLIAGGNRTGTIDTNTLASAELFNPATGTFSATATPMSSARFLHTATLLPNGRVLIVGGVDQNHATVLASAELFDPATETFSTVPSPMTVARSGHTATLLPAGKVLIAGGLDSSSGAYVSLAELYDPAAVAPAASFATTGALVTPRWQHAAALLPNGQVLLVGGSLRHAELYDPASGVFAPTGGMRTAREYHTLTALGTSGKVLVVGGDDVISLESAEIYQ